jgi:Leucine-rich repeat (LRR) protein
VNATKLTGNVPDIFEPFRFLRFADFSDNLFAGTLPGTIFDLPMIEILYFSGNTLTGTIPSNLGNAAALRDLYINNNQISGTVPSILTGQLRSLTEFRLELNRIVGSMPESICALRGDNENTTLVTLISDCGGVTPEIICECCTTCIPE